ncbi:DMT family transporter [Candidatus Parcubacteria bacterium]|nr:DMT family transporter [Candidatus Parcubacteria bacterium]
MPQELFIAILAGLGGMFGWGLADFFAKKTIDVVGDIVSLAWGHVFGTIILLIVVLFRIGTQDFHMLKPLSLSMLITLCLFGIAQAAVYIFLYKGFGKGQLAVLNPIFASFSGITSVLSIVFFKEVVSSYLLIGLATLFLGVLLMSIDLNALLSKRLNFMHVPGFKEIIMATLIAALWTLFWDRFIGGNDWLLYVTFMYVVMTFVILVVVKWRRLDLFVVKSQTWKYLLLMGLCEVIAYLAISIGYGVTSLTSVVALLSGAFSLPTIILARVFLKEKITRTQTVGSIIVIIGIMVLSVL